MLNALSAKEWLYTEAWTSSTNDTMDEQCARGNSSHPVFPITL